MPTRRRKTSLPGPRDREVAHEGAEDGTNSSSEVRDRSDCDPLRARLGPDHESAATTYRARRLHHHKETHKPASMFALRGLLSSCSSIARSLAAFVLIVLITSAPNSAQKSHQLAPWNEHHQSGVHPAGKPTTPQSLWPAPAGLLEVATAGRPTFNDVTLRKRHRRQQLAESALKYHLNHLQPPSPVPMTVERRQAAGSASPAHTTSFATSNHHRGHPSIEALTGGAEPMATAASLDNELVQLQLPLQLHLRLRPVALPQPPPPLASRSSGPLDSAGKRRRSLEPDPQLGDKQKPHQQQQAAASAPSATFLPAAHDAAQTALGWQEAKRVLLMNSVAPPLVQLASRRLGRRFVASTPTTTPSPPQASASRAPGAKTPAGAQDVTAAGLATTPPPAQTGNQLDEASRRPPATKRHQFVQLSGATRQQPASGTNKLQEPTRSQRLVSQQVERLDGDIESLQGGHQAARHPLENTRPIIGGDDESRIQSIAAAMLPFVWPSFQLTTISLKAAAASKLKARSLATSAQPTSDSSPTPPMAVWPMEYQQLDRASLSSSTTSTTGRTPAQASELRPTLAAPAHTDQAEARVRRRELPTNRPITTTSSSAATNVSPATTNKKSATTLEKPVRTNSKKRMKSANYLQAGKQDTTPAYEDSTRLASKYAMPRIKFNASSTLAPFSSPPIETALRLEPAQGQPANATDGSTATGFQMPRTLIRLIEQQLLSSIRGSSGGGDSSSSNSKQTAALLRYISTQQEESGAKANATSKRFPSTPAPTTSVSKVVRLVQPATPVLEIEVNSRNSVSFAKAPQASTQRAIAAPSSPTSAANGTFALADLERTVKENAAASSSMAPSTKSQAPARNISRLNVAEAFSTLATQSSGELLRSLEQPPTSTDPSVSATSSTQSAPTSTTSTTTTTSTTPTPATSTTTRPASSTTGRQQELLTVAEAEHIGNNKVLPDDEEATTIASVTSTSSSTTGKPRKFGASNGGGGHTPATQAQLNNKNNHQLRKASQTGGQTGAKSQIKLFHFKRKPDVAKLPFYKKPLNFTELGWTPEEIERELARQRAEGELPESEDDSARTKKSARASNGKWSAESGGEPQADDDESPANPARAISPDRAADEPSGSPVTPLDTGRLLLLKRKRRAKNQFERLMAELQEAAAAAAATAATESPGAPTSPNFKARLTGDEWRLPVAGPLAMSSNDEFINSELVPVLRKKQEPLVMKPMFFVMSQKRRVASSADQEAEKAASLPTLSANDTSSRQQNRLANATLDEESQLPQQRSKPIVRMRRKHHGEQPELRAGSPSQSAWRPSKADWLPPTTTQPRVMLVPSGLLTPSGSHPMPLFAPDATSVWSAGPQHQIELAHGQRPDGFVVAQSSSPVAVHQEEQPAGAEAPQAPAASAQPTVSQLVSQNSATSELRVPKLLVKPMRPAKYSLNGYIPKPSLTNALGLQQGHHQAQLSAPPTSQRTPLLNAANQQQQQVMQTPRSLHAPSNVPPNANPNSGSGRSSKPMKRQPLPNGRPTTGGAQSSSSLPAAAAANFQNKDLDSSTSNEIFSHRRGLQQQQQRSAMPLKRNISFESLLTSSSSSSSPANAIDEQPLLVVAASSSANGARNDSLPSLLSADTQMEANRRKYVKQHQANSAFKSPTLSLQRANQIKAKLGLSSSFAPSSGSRKMASEKATPLAADNQQLASVNSISHLEPAVSETDEQAETSKLLIGAPLNTIPKTDFECTDSRGRFKSGLYADTKTGCQVWHLCSNNRKYSFLCPSGTIFNAKVRICDWRYNVKCE